MSPASYVLQRASRPTIERVLEPQLWTLSAAERVLTRFRWQCCQFGFTPVASASDQGSNVIRYTSDQLPVTLLVPPAIRMVLPGIG